LRKLIFFLIAVAAIISAAVIWVVLSHGFPIALMDLNDDGFVSPREFVASIDYGHRPASDREGDCTEIFFLKDGMPLKVICKD